MEERDIQLRRSSPPLFFLRKADNKNNLKRIIFEFSNYEMNSSFIPFLRVQKNSPLSPILCSILDIKEPLFILDKNTQRNSF